MNRHTTYDDWFPGELATLPEKIARVNGARTMTLRDELERILYDALAEWAETGRGKPLPQIADEWLALFREALLASHVVAYAHRQVNNEYVLPAHLTEGIAAALDAVTGEGAK